MLWTDIERFGLLDPWQAFDNLNNALSGKAGPRRGEFPAVDVWVNGDDAVVTMELPGIDAKEVDISVVGKTLTLRGSRKPGESCEGECFHRRERWYGEFSRSIDLPYMIDQEKVDARFSKGILTLRLPRAEADKPRKIAVKFE